MTDLHCHILPGMDDGAKDAAESVELLRREHADGVRNIVLTSHFNCKYESVVSFLNRRQQAFEQLQEALGGADMGLQLKLGAEVYFSPELCDMDAESLCMEGTSYLLVEFPLTHRPHFICQTFRNLNNRGIYPIIAHVERYPFLMEDPAFLYELVASGAYAQVNTETLLKAGQVRQILQLMKWDLVHVIATDAHSLTKRPPQLEAALKVVENKLGVNMVRQICSNAVELFHDREPDINPHRPGQFLGRWI